MSLKKKVIQSFTQVTSTDTLRRAAVIQWCAKKIRQVLPKLWDVKWSDTDVTYWWRICMWLHSCHSSIKEGLVSLGDVTRWWCCDVTRTSLPIVSDTFCPNVTVSQPCVVFMSVLIIVNYLYLLWLNQINFVHSKVIISSSKIREIIYFLLVYIIASLEVLFEINSTSDFWKRKIGTSPKDEFLFSSFQQSPVLGMLF